MVNIRESFRPPFLTAHQKKTENVMTSRLYKEYQARVAMFWPPITTFKAVLLTVMGVKGRVDDLVFGTASAKKEL